MEKIKTLKRGQVLVNAAMKLFKPVPVACIFFALTHSQVLAHDSSVNKSQVSTMTDAQAIEHSMKKLFDKPEAPLSVAPISIEGDYAVAGWIQSGKGGRALLKKEKGKWSIQVCGGDGLKNSSALVQTGMSSTNAERLAKKVQMSEAKLNADQLKKLSMFEGVVKVDGASHGAHSTSQDHHTQPNKH